jgi:(2R)-sulfolactate sulfo-lyase subunit alpha
MIHFLVHEKKDNVGVAVVDVKKGQRLQGRFLSGRGAVRVTARDRIPLGHKVALTDFKVADSVTKYGCVIGRVVKAIRAGNHVHVHNLKTRKWA